NRKVSDISGDVLSLFNDYDWPGNVRELEHVIEGAINLVVSSRTIERRHLQSHLTTWRRLRGQPDAIQPPLPGSSSDGSDVHRPLQDRLSVPSSMVNVSSEDSGKGLLETQSDHERSVVMQALVIHRGNITRAAHSIGISRQLFNYKMKKYRLNRKDYSA
ncbi:MAG: helix-turn-helix domain-containing protein, partial [Desulfosarcina sp.]